MVGLPRVQPARHHPAGSRGNVPADRAAFERYRDSAPREVRIDRPVRELLRRLMMLEFLPLPVNAALGPVNVFLTAGSLPPPFREQMRLGRTRRDQRQFELLMRTIAPVNGGAARPSPSSRSMPACRTWGRGSRGTTAAEHLPDAWRPGHRFRSAARSARSGSAARFAPRGFGRQNTHPRRRFPHDLTGQPGASEHPPQGPLIRFPAELGLEDPASVPRSGPGSPFQRRHVAPLGADDPGCGSRRG